MKIRIEDDVFEITKRVKEIDEGYYIVFDTDKQSYELHNSNQLTSYCLTVPYQILDSRCVDLILYSSVANIDNIIEDIDNNNNIIENHNLNHVKNQSEFMLREIYEFFNNSSKKFCNNSFETKWR